MNVNLLFSLRERRCDQYESRRFVDIRLWLLINPRLYLWWWSQHVVDTRIRHDQHRLCKLAHRHIDDKRSIQLQFNRYRQAMLVSMSNRFQTKQERHSCNVKSACKCLIMLDVDGREQPQTLIPAAMFPSFDYLNTLNLPGL
jgi:hypothetical protein